MTSTTPKEITRANAHDVRVLWEDGHACVFPARALRLQCPCAGCVDEVTGHVIVLATNVPTDVHPLRIERVGHYAMTIHWSDGHHTGIYAFDRLRERCPCADRTARQQTSA